MNVKACVAALCIITSAANAQKQERTPPRQAGPSTLVGIVTDTSGDFPIDSVQVFINALKRQTLTSANGTFRFNDIKPGKYQIATRKLGYLPQVKTVVVADSGGSVRFEILQQTHALPTMVTSATALGLSGVIGDTAYDVIQGAEVYAITTDKRVRTDSMGRFFMDLRPGRYMIQVSKEGYGTKIMGVTVPVDSGRRMVTWLAPADRGLQNRQTMNLFELAERIEKTPSTRKKLYSREDITKLNFEELRQVAIAGAGKPVPEECDAIIDGGPVKYPIWSISAADLDMVEVYVDGMARQTVTSIPMRGKAGPPPTAAPDRCDGVKIYAWLRK